MVSSSFVDAHTKGGKEVKKLLKKGKTPEEILTLIENPYRSPNTRKDFERGVAEALAAYKKGKDHAANNPH